MKKLKIELTKDEVEAVLASLPLFILLTEFQPDVTALDILKLRQFENKLQSELDKFNEASNG